MCKEEEKDMEAVVEKYDIKEALEQSLKEMKLMREGKMKKRNWREMFKDINKDIEDGKL